MTAMSKAPNPFERWADLPADARADRHTHWGGRCAACGTHRADGTTQTTADQAATTEGKKR